MALPSEHLMEHLSASYVSAIVSLAGARYVPHPQPEYGIDGHIVKVHRLSNGKFVDTGHMVLVQIKASTNCRLSEKHIAFDVEVDAYNKLAAFEGPTPIFLIVYRMPKEEKDWHQWSEEELLLRSCCYYYKIPPAVSSNQQSQVVHIPRSQVFNPTTVSNLFDSVQATMPMGTRV